jgi:hypothetical protein
MQRHPIWTGVLQGVQHIAFATDDPMRAIEHARRRSPRGIGVLQAGTVPSQGEGLRYTYLDTAQDLGVVAEVWEPSPGFQFPKPHEVYPPGEL